MATVTVRPYRDEADLQPMLELLNLCDRTDRLEDETTIADLRAELTLPGFDPNCDIRLWEAPNGSLIAFATLWLRDGEGRIDGNLWFRVHPDWRGGESEGEVFDWADERMRALGQERGIAAGIIAGLRDDKHDQRIVLERADFRAVRSYYRMARSLDLPIPAPVLPDGFVIRYLTGPEEAEEWAACYNESFVDHFNFRPMSVDKRLEWMKRPFYRAEDDLIVVAPDGRIAAFAWCEVNTEHNAQLGVAEGWIDRLGTRRGFRRLGLGRAIALAALRRLRGEGLSTALLGVDAANPTGALQLYESVGFSPVNTHITYAKDV